MARQAIQFVEVDVPVCSLSYGVAPCTAAIPTTGDAKCFNTLATCQDAANYAASTVTLRFVEDVGYRPLSIEAFPSLSAVQFSPALIAPGQDLGERAVLSVALKDHKHADTGAGFDPYQTTRGYDPFERGSFFGRFRARQPYLRGAAVRWYMGYADQALSEMECRNFVVESIDGPSVDGVFSLKAIDPLKMLDGDRAQAPAVSGGRLNAGILAAATSAVLTPAGIGNTDYAASGYVALAGSEVASFTRSGDTLTLVRAQYNTVAADHDAADRVQTVLRYVSADPADIIYDLMVTYAGVPAGYITLSEWQAETAAYLRRQYTGIIGQPTPVAQLVAELMSECGLSIWWDDVAAKIKLRVLRALPADAQAFDRGNILEGTFSRQENPGKRISQVWVHYSRKNPLTGDADPENHRQFKAVADLANETNYGAMALRQIYSRWIPAGGSSAAQRIGDLLIGRYGVPPRSFTFTVMRDAQANPQLGNAYALSWRTEQSADGSEEVVPIQVLRVTALKDRFVVEAEEIQFDSLDSEDLDERSITIDYNAMNLNLRDMHDELYPDPVAGDVVSFIVEEGVIIGSHSTSEAALRTGTWPTRNQTGNRTSGSPILTGLSVNTAGMRVSGTGIPAGAKILTVDSSSQITLTANATSGAGTSTTLTITTVLLTLIVRGRVQGMGGTGGTGAKGTGDVAGTDGAVGGDALLLEAAITLTDTDGELFGGGGGGGGGPCRNPNDHDGGGGGGGAGSDGGTGGIGPGSARDGDPGSSEAGGGGGDGWTNDSFFGFPRLDSTRKGGDGGAPGLAGQAGQGSSDLAKGLGGAAGNAINGLSQALASGAAGDRRGGQIN